MDFKNLLLSFDGRIGRQSWWIGVIVLTVLSMDTHACAGLVFGTSMMGGMDPNMAPEQAAEMASMSHDSARHRIPGISLSGARHLRQALA